MKYFALIAPMLALAVPTAGHAMQIMPTVPGHDRVSVEDGEEIAATRKTADLFARCLLRTKPTSIARVLTIADESAFENALSGLELNDCLEKGTLRFDAALMRGALYVAMYRRDYGDAPRAPTAADMQAAYGKVAKAGSSRAGLLAFGMCVSQKDFSSTRRAVLSVPGSPEEDAAYASLAPAFERCLFEGTTLRFNRTSLQGILAEALYREADLSDRGADTAAAMQEAAE